jgi:hypothetical protein
MSINTHNSWYRKASVNPWSIFEDVSFNRDLGVYDKVVINRSKLSLFLYDASSNEVRDSYSKAYKFYLVGEFNDGLDIGIFLGENARVTIDEAGGNMYAQEAQNCAKLTKHAELIVERLNSLGEPLLKCEAQTDVKYANAPLYECKVWCQFHGEVILV